MERREQRASLFFFSFFFCSSTLKVLQHLRSTAPGAGVDFHHRWSFVHTSLCVSPAGQGSSGPPGGGKESGAEWSPNDFIMTRSSCPALNEPMRSSVHCDYVKTVSVKGNVH